MPDPQLLLLIVLTFVINLVGSLAYSVRIAGVRTLRIAVSLSLFNILLLVSRTANSVQGPLLAKRIEGGLALGLPASATDFRWLLAAASIATLAGAALTPTFQRLFTRAVTRFAADRSMGRLLLRVFRPGALAGFREAVAAPAGENLRELVKGSRLPTRIIVLNTVVTAIWTVGVLSALYAGALNPALRVTSSSLSALINGGATILLAIVVDPYLSLLTDDVLQGRVGEPFFRRCVVWMLASRFAGTVVAQLLLLPAAHLIAAAAQTL
jgi:hypothetical protein